MQLFRTALRTTTRSCTRFYTNTSLVNMGLHEYSLNKLNGESVKLDCYKGKVVLLENVATL